MNILENDCEEGRQFYEEDGRSTFTCRICGKAEYRNGEFETIKMGDIFTHITHFPSISEEDSERERLCSSCTNLNFHLHSSPESSTTKLLQLHPSSGTATIMQNLNHSNHSSSNFINNNNNNSRSSCSSNTSNLLQSATPSPPILLHSHSPNPPGNIHHHHLTTTHSPPTPTMYRDNNNSMQQMSTINQPQRIHSNTAISHSSTHNTISPHQNQNLTVLTTVNNSTTEDADIKYPLSFYHSHPPVIIHSNTNGGIGGENPSNSTAAVVIKSEFPLESPPVVVPVPLPQQHPPTFESSAGNPPVGKECHVCNQTFKNNKTARVHFQKVHEKIGKYVCEICGAVFSYRGSLDSHLAAHNPPAVTHDCPTCGQKFKEKSNLTAHMKTHLDIPKKFKCDLCPSEFSKKVNLRYHTKRKHPPPAEGMSETNGSSSNNPSDTKTDATKLTGKEKDGKDDKPQGNFKCEHCGRCFLFKNNLKAHLRTHTRDKKYTCEICEKSFIYKESLKNHMLLHSNTLPYLCEICGKKFRDRSNRRKHVKNVHKYMFINSDGTAAANPLVTTNGEVSKNPKTPSATSSPTKTPGKRKRNSKKSDASESSGNMTSTQTTAKSPEDKSTGIIKSTPKAKKTPKNNSSATKTTNNKKSVIVSAASTLPDSRDLDRKIIMSPSLKTSGNSGEFAHSHPHSLPLTVHVPLSGSNLSPSQYNHGLSHGRNVIVKASSTISSSNQSSNLSPSLDLYQQQQQQQQQQQRVSHQQNVIVYPKPKLMSESQPYPPNSVISQNLQQQQQYYNHNHPSQGPEGGGGGYSQQGNYIPMPMTGLVSPPSSIPPPQPSRPSSNSAFDYVLSTNTSSDRSNEITRYGGPPPHRSMGRHPSGEVPVVNVTNQYSHSVVYPDSVSYGQQEHPHPHPHHDHYWLSSVDSNPSNHPPTSSSPYNVAARPSETPASVTAYEGPITAASNVLNAPTYTVLHGQQEGVQDPSGNGNFFFDFTYLN